MRKLSLILFAYLLIEPAAAQDQLPSIELPPELDRVLRDYEAGWQGGDAQGLAALFLRKTDSSCRPIGPRFAVERPLRIGTQA